MEWLNCRLNRGEFLKLSAAAISAEPLAQLELNPYTWTVIRSVKWNERYVHIKISACTA